MTILPLIGGSYLFAAAAAPPWWLFPIFALLGFVMLGIGGYGIAKRRAFVPAKFRRVLRLFGVDDVTGTLAVVIGTGQCFAGCMALACAIAGPFFAGVLGTQQQANVAGPLRAHLPELDGELARYSSPRAGSVAPNRQPRVDSPPSSESTLQVAGTSRGELFRDQADEGGLLVGLRLAKGKNWGGALQGVQPVYQVGTGYQIGVRHGTPGGDEYELIAKPGYAIGAINARAGLVLNAVQVVFRRIDEKRLDLNDSYTSDWIGCDGGDLFQIDPQGDPIVAVYGSLQEDIVSFGIDWMPELAQSVPLPEVPPPDLYSEPRPGQRLGRAEGTEFVDLAPAGCVLVGVRISCDMPPNPTVHSVQPIYLGPSGYVEGKRHGEGGEFETAVVARPGFAVGGIEYHRFADSAGLRLLFMKATPDGLVGQESYHSPWLGYPWEQGQQRTDSAGRFVAGITGYAGEVINGIGLMSVSCRSVRWSGEPIPLSKEIERAMLARPPLRANKAVGVSFSDEAPAGGLLVGLMLATGKNWGGALQAAQPIYQLGSTLQRGNRYGKVGGKEHEVLARSGYAVGAVRARAGLVLNAVQLVFYRIDGTRLDHTDSYQSEWIGCDGGGPFNLDAGGDPIVRLFGSYQEDLVSLGIQPIGALSQPIPKPSRDNPDVKPATTALRIWRSADGNSTVEAKLIVSDGQTVELERRDGKRVTVPVDKLSKEDIDFVRDAQDCPGLHSPITMGN